MKNDFISAVAEGLSGAGVFHWMVFDSEGDVISLMPGPSAHDVCKVSAYTERVEDELIEKLSEAHCVLGCVAWLTNFRILCALSKLYTVHIVVQKEDFLRPDPDSSGTWKTRLREAYAALPDCLYRYEIPFCGHISYCGSNDFGSVRCAGGHNRDRLPAFPRMHHKFLIFCSVDRESGWQPCVRPYAVWTGSFNMTHNSERSRENAVYIESPAIAWMYLAEFAGVLSISEPLDWEEDWVEPEWRIGS